MKVRSIVGSIVFGLILCASSAQAAAINYTINFSGGGSNISAIGPGSFSYDSAGKTNTIVGPPVTLTNYQVPITFGTSELLNVVTFTQTSPQDDDAVINKSGFVTAVSVDSFSDVGMLQLNNDNTWVFELPSISQTDVAVKQAASGTYTISVPTGVPEPASAGLIVAGLGALLLLRRRLSFR